MGPRNHVLDEVQIGHCERTIFRGKDMSGYARRHSAVSCAKMAEPTDMSFRLWTRLGPRKHVLGGVHSGATWRIQLNSPCAAAMRPFCQITLTTCLGLPILLTNRQTAVKTVLLKKVAEENVVRNDRKLN